MFLKVKPILYSKVCKTLVPVSSIFLKLKSKMLALVGEELPSNGEAINGEPREVDGLMPALAGEIGEEDALSKEPLLDSRIL